MPKTSRRAVTTTDQPAPARLGDAALADFAQDLGTLLGQAQNKAENWLAQRKAIVDHLTEVRDTARRLLAQLGVTETARTASKPQSDPAAAPKKAKRAPSSGRKRRTMSAEAREKIAAAQRARWAKQKRQGRE